MNFVLKKDPQTSRLRAVGSFREQIQDEQEQHWFLLSASHPWPWHVALGARRARCPCLFSWGPGRWHGKQIYPWRSGPQCGCTGSLQIVCTRADVPVRSSTRLWGSLPCYEESLLSLCRQPWRPNTLALQEDTTMAAVLNVWTLLFCTVPNSTQLPHLSQTFAAQYLGRHNVFSLCCGNID